MNTDSTFKAPANIAEAEAGFRDAVNAMGMPEDAYRIAIPDDAHGGRGFDLPAIMFKNRMLYLHSDVSQPAIHALSMQLHYLCSQPVLKTPNRARRITIYIDSPGGLVAWGMTLYNYIRQAEAITREPVVTVIQTMGASMGSLLPQAATTGYRLMLPYSTMMIHALAYGNQGKRESHTRGSGDTRHSMAQLYEVYIDKMAEARSLFGDEEDTPELRGEILGWLLDQMEDEDTFMTPLQCLDAGLTDFVAHTEEEQFAYYRALDWYHGLYKKAANPEAPGETMLVGAELDEGSGRVVALFEHSDDEKAEALAEIKRLQKANYEKTKAFEERKLPIVAALKALDDRREERGRGPKGSDYDPHTEAVDVFIEALKSKDDS